MVEPSVRPGNRREILASLLTASQLSIDRMPVLKKVLESAAGSCAEDLREQFDVELQLTLDGLERGTEAELFADCRGGGAFSILQERQWDANLIVGLDRAAVMIVTDLFLGGDFSEWPEDADRPNSKIETGLAKLFNESLAGALNEALSQSSPIEFVPASTRDCPGDSALGFGDEASVLIRFRMVVAHRIGFVLIVFSQGVFDCLRRLLGQPAAEVTARPDPEWARHIKQEITRTNLTLHAILDSWQAPLVEIAGLKAGQVIELKVAPQCHVCVECDGELLFWGEFGQSNGRYTIQAVDFVDRNQEFMDSILFG